MKRSIAGAGPKCDRQVRILGRIISYSDEGWQMEADPQHLEVAASQLGLSNAKGVASPIAEDSGALSAAAIRTIRLELGQGGAPSVNRVNDEGSLLSEESKKLYQSIAARLNYLSLDRPDVGFSVKELMRRMSAPYDANLVALKRVVRYLLSMPRVAYLYHWAPLSDELVVFGDANWAGCPRSRKSTLGGVTTWGGRPLKTWSKTLPTLALSSGESELAAVVRSCGEGLGTQSVLADFGFKTKLIVRSDATAAIGMCKREGLGRVRHLATADLWVQQLVRRKGVVLEKWPTATNPADLLTKGLGRSKIQSLLQCMYLQAQGGRPDIAPVRENAAPVFGPSMYINEDLDSDREK